MVSTTLELDIICNPHSRVNTYNLLSWSPDWRWKQHGSKRRRNLNLTIPRFTTEKGSLAIYSFYKNANGIETLRARGFSLDKIRVTGNPAYICDRETVNCVVSSFEEWRKVFIDEKGDSLEAYKKFFETITCACTWASEDTSSHDMLMQYFLHAVTELCPKTSTDEILLDIWESSKSSYKPSFTNEDHARYGVLLIYELRKQIVGRRFFISSSGIMGMAPAEAEVGDEICILLGSSCPVILRPHNGGEFYTLIGETYLDGYMHGKGMDEVEEGKFTMKDFDIQ